MRYTKIPRAIITRLLEPWLKRLCWALGLFFAPKPNRTDLLFYEDFH